MMKNYTKGPWKIARETSGRFEVQNDSGITIADIWKDMGKGFPLDKESSTNAHLIAAAPELLEALEEIVKPLMDRYEAGCADADWYNNNMPGVGQTLDYKSRPEMPQELEKATRAINKALGKEQ
jgi:hypothetical protein